MGGHSCLGRHPAECVRGHRCNLEMDVPACLRQYTLDLGEVSSDSTLCKSNHIDPRTSACAIVPEIEYKFGLPVVLGRDCTNNNQCLRADESVGDCACKQWWDGT